MKLVQDRTVKPVVWGQSSSSFVPSVMKTDVPLESDDRAHKDLPLKKNEEWIEKFSQQDTLCKFCPDAGFLTTVEVGQYFMTTDFEFWQFTDSVACREYTLPRDEEASEPKGWIRGNNKIGSVLEVATCCLHGKHGVEIRIMSMNKSNSYSWVRISHGLNELVTNLNNSEQETSEMQFEEYALKIECKWFCKPIKGERKTTKTRFCQLIHKNYTYWRKNLDRCWTMIEKMMEQLNSWESKTVFRNMSSIVIVGLTTSGRKPWQEEEEKRDTSIVLIHHE